MSNKRKEAPAADVDDVIEDDEKVKKLKAKRSKGKERVSFADKDQTVCTFSHLLFSRHHITTYFSTHFNIFNSYYIDYASSVHSNHISVAHEHIVILSTACLQC